MNLQSKYKLHQTVEYIKLQEWCFDTLDVVEAIDTVLSHFGFDDSFSSEEKDLLKEELFEIAFRFEVVEVVHLSKENPQILV
tara:strand:- start:212 stop:457 length:246 start_codon:yes stop_codon:yes gene_type:complete